MERKKTPYSGKSTSEINDGPKATQETSGCSLDSNIEIFDKDVPEVTSGGDVNTSSVETSGDTNVNNKLSSQNVSEDEILKMKVTEIINVENGSTKSKKDWTRVTGIKNVTFI